MGELPTTPALERLVTSLVTGGMTPAAAAILVAEAIIEATAKKKTAGAVRQARYRERHKASQSVTEPSPHSVGIPVTEASQSVTSNASVTKVPLTLSSSLTVSSKERVVEIQNSEPRAKVRRGTRLPDDWWISEADRLYAAKHGLGESEIEIEATKFLNYWTNRTDKMAAKPRWDRAWQNWVLTARSNYGKTPNPPSNKGGMSRALEQLKLSIREDESGQTGGFDPFGLLPSG